jgi:glycosyltransferase involved in cell wall biosynthesis
MEKILMIHRIFASYRKPIYDKLAEKYNYLLLHGNKDATINQSSTRYSQVIKGFQYTSNPTNLFFESFSPLLKFKPKVVIHEFAIGMLSLIPMYLVSRLMRAKFILYSHGYNRMTGFNPKQSWADKYRVFLMKLADATVIYSNTDKRMLSEFADGQKIFVAQNTLDMTELLAIKKDFEQEGQAAIKAKVGFTHQYNLTFIGRLLDDKMPEKVLEVFELLNAVLPNKVGIHFVGGGDLTKLQAIVAEKGWGNDVKFYGAVYDDRKSGEFLFASDMMIMPGYLGLAVNHAFAFNCPVVSFKRTKTGPFHSPEIEYVVEGETGFLISDLSVEKMAQTVANYLQDESLQQRMKSIIRHKIESELTTDNMVKGFTDAVSFVLNKTN